MTFIFRNILKNTINTQKHLLSKTGEKKNSWNNKTALEINHTILH